MNKFGIYKHIDSIQIRPVGIIKRVKVDVNNAHFKLGPQRSISSR